MYNIDNKVKDDGLLLTFKILSRIVCRYVSLALCIDMHSVVLVAAIHNLCNASADNKA